MFALPQTTWPRRFAADTNGNFAVIFAVSIIPVVALAGAAIDYSRILSAEHKLQAAADSAVLAAAAGGGTPAAMRHTAEEFVAANAPGLAATVKATVNSRDMTVEVSAVLPLPVLSAVGMPEAEIRVLSKAESLVPFAGDSVTEVNRDADSREFERRVKDLRRRFARSTRHWPKPVRDRLDRRLERQIEAARETLRRQPGTIRLSR